MLRSGMTWSYPAIDSEIVLHELETLKQRMNEGFGEALSGFHSENDNLRTIKATQIRTHFARRRRADEQRLATARARQREARFIRMFEGNLTRLAGREDERLHKLEREALGAPENFEDVACGIVRVISKAQL